MSIRVNIREFPPGSEINLGGSIVRAKRDTDTGQPYVECEDERQIHLLEELEGIVGPALQVEDPPSAGGSDGLGTHTLNTDQVAELVEATDSLEDLEGLLTSEKAHPKHQGGRRGALHAIQQRISALTKE